MRANIGVRRLVGTALIIFGTALVGATGLAAVSPAAGATAGAGITGWTEVGSSDQNTLMAGEGVATVSTPHGTSILYRGLQSIPSNLKAQGWAHIGDPDSVRGYVIDAYQGPGTGGSKMFLVTTPSGSTYQYVHTLVRGEEYNNSFDTISPNAQWTVAGEWDTMSHLQIYPTPLLNRETPRRGGSLKLAGYIKLDHKVNDIQGCDFVTAAKLLCVSDDDSRSLFTDEKPLLQIDLARAINGTSVKGHVVDLGPIPQQSTCTGTFEAEGIDFDRSTGILRLEMIQPSSCILKTTVYEYKQVRGRA